MTPDEVIERLEREGINHECWTPEGEAEWFAMADAANALMAYDKTMTRIAEGGDA